MDLVKVFDSTFNDLIRLERSFETNSIELFYVKVLKLYHSGHLEKLLELIKSNTQEDKVWSECKQVALARCCILKREYHHKDVLDLKKNLDSFTIFKAEALSVVGWIEFVDTDYSSSKSHFTRALEEFEKIGCEIKCHICKINILACDSWLNPRSNLFQKHLELAKEFENSNYLSGTVSIYKYLGSEYLRIHDFSKALEYTNMAIANSSDDTSSIQSMGSLCLKWFILWLSKDLGELPKVESKIKQSDIPIIKQTLSQLELLREGKDVQEVEDHFFDSLFTRYRRFSWSETLTEFERSILRTLLEGPKTIIEIGKIIYGETLDERILEERLNTLLYKINKYRPGIIYREDNVFYFDILKGGDEA